MSTMTPPFWAAADWLGQVQAWAGAQLERANRRITGPLEQIHLRPWSTVLRVPTDAGNVFFKAVAPTATCEVAITAALAGWHPGMIPQLLASDTPRGWMLLADGGARLREIIRADRNLGHWHALLPYYAALQIDMAVHLDELLALGAPDYRLAALPGRYAMLLGDTGLLWIDQPGGLAAEEHARLLALAPQVGAWCAELAAYAIPESLNHGDLHDGNIFVGAGDARIFDWGDSSVTHPFFSLRTAFVSIENSLGLEEGAPEFAGVRDAYLAPWARYAGLARLREAFALAQRLAPLCGALGWAHVVGSLPPAQRAEYAQPVPALLQEFLGYAEASS